MDITKIMMLKEEWEKMRNRMVATLFEETKKKQAQPLHPKPLEYYQSLNYSMRLWFDQEDKVWFICFPDLPGCLAHGDTIKQTIVNGLTAKNEWLEAVYMMKWKIPEPKER